MTTISSIASGLRKFSGKPLSVLSKTIGVGAIAAVAYDAHVNGVLKADSTDMNSTADRWYKNYKQFLSSEKQSASINKAKRVWFNMQNNFAYYHPIYKIKGYISGAGNTILNELPTIGLAVAALAFKKVSKVAGVLLAIHGLKTLFYDVMGIGRKKDRKI